jgi:Flp pilus assembly protein TadG
MRTNHKAARRRKGFVSVYVAFSSFLLIPMAGLAIDFAVLYSVKARLQTAVDAAAVGSGNTLNRGSLMDITAVNDVALRFFNANFPTGYFGSTAVYYNSTPVQGTLGIRTITINASQHVPMLFMRVLGISQSTVAATAQVTVRFVNMILVVDRSGSVFRATYNGTPTMQIVDADLHQFVDPSDGSASPYFSDGRDNIGLITFGGSWRLDFPLSVNFQTATPHIGTAIDAIDWNTNNSTNTAEGLFHGFRELEKLAQPGALNVIVMLTDGRPTAFSGTFPLKIPTSGSTCTNKTAKVGWLFSPTGWPPPASGGTTEGVMQSMWQGAGLETNTNYVASNSTSCAYKSNLANVNSDITLIPASVAPPDDNALNRTFLTNRATNSDLPAFAGATTNTADQKSIRYSSFNVADNIATMIRTDTNITPVIFVIGLNNNNGEEPLDADWLARVANDKDYLDVNGNHVFLTGQTQGKYFDVNAGGIGNALTQIASEILRLTR